MLQCAILAGGLATRLGNITKKSPKSMVLIENKPFLEYQLNLLRKNNVTKVILCVGHLSHYIQDHFKEGKKFGLEIQYSVEDNENLLGTGGALKNAANILEDHFFVLYGDSFLDINYQKLYNFFLSKNRPEVLTIYKNDDKWDCSNVEFIDGQIKNYSKTDKTNNMHYIDYGLSILSKNVIVENIPENTYYDLAYLYEKLSHENLLAGYEVTETFYEIGSIQGIKRFQEYILRKGL